MGAFWDFLRDPANRDILAWLGGGAVVVVGGVWAVVKFFVKKDKSTPAVQVTASNGGVAAGGSMTGNKINTNAGRQPREK